MRKRILHFIFSMLLLLTVFPAAINAQGELISSDGQTIIITGPNSYLGGSFNGTINGNGANVTSITFSGTITDKAVFTFDKVSTDKLIIEPGADIVIEMKGGSGNNNLGEIINDGTLFLQGNTFQVSQQEAAKNNAFLTDSTASIRIVEGAAPVTMGICEGSEVHNSEAAPVKGIVVAEGRPEYVTFIWQRKEVLWWVDKDTIDIPVRSRIVTCNHEVSKAGQYRFRAIVKGENAETALISSTSEVKMTYDVVLPQVEGATTDPVAGTYVVYDDGRFDFSLSLNPGYRESEPIIRTSRGDTIDLNMEGYYSIKSISDSLTIFIDGIEPDSPSSNDVIQINDIEIKAGHQQIEIDTPKTTYMELFTFDGVTKMLKTLPAGNHIIPISSGIYILKIDGKASKIGVN